MRTARQRNAFNDHVVIVVDANTTGHLFDWLVGQDAELLEQCDLVN